MTLAITTVASLLALSMQTTPASAPQEAQSAETAPAAQTTAQAAPAPEKITDRNHPDFIRCRREPIIGSRARFTKRCHTNREWELIARRGNEGTRTIVEAGQSGQVGN